MGRNGTTRLAFKDGVNILYGRNGKGKTTILDFIASSFTNDTNYIKYVDFTECRVRIAVPEYGTEITKSIAKK